MSYNSDQFRLTIRRVLKSLPNPYNSNESTWSKSAENLLLGTAAVESDFGTYLIQKGHEDNIGTAKSPFQIEDATFLDSLQYIKTEKRDHWNLLNQAIRSEYMIYGNNPQPKELMYNLGLGICLCRVKYLRVPHSLPLHDKINALGSYWKFHYNASGKNVPEEIDRFGVKYRKYVE